jgi:hypothetical protein
MMKYFLAVFAMMAMPIETAAIAANASLIEPRTGRIDAEPVFTSTLTRLVGTKLRYVGEGAPEITVPAMTRTRMPSLAGWMRCPGKSRCYLEAVIEAQVFNLTGAMGFDLIVDGNPMDSAIGSVHAFNTGTYEITQRRFVIELLPGPHKFDVVTFGTEGFTYVRHAATYKLYKK